MKRVLAPEEIPAEVVQISQEWQRKRSFDPAAHRNALSAIFREVLAVQESEWDASRTLRSILARYPKDGKGFYAKSDLVAGFRLLIDEGEIDPDPLLLDRIRMKPVRTSSGVAPVTVLTAPAGCPGQCIFCPDDWRMPKSYIFDEPGAQRAERDGFDPFKQTLGRIDAFESIGHDTSKVELLILGGTWSAYGQDYREWFVRRCFDAMNSYRDPGYVTSSSLEEAQQSNVLSAHRNVGLVVETRPDWITPDEIRHMRRLGVTKVQIGVQSLDDEVLDLNKRGHTVAEVRQALGLLRTAGFKLHLHWMPNLYGATLDSDRVSFRRFYDDPAIRPDELKIYPCSLIAGTELYQRWLAGDYHPYSEPELVALLADIKPTVPPYTRINRLFRDIPAHHIEAGVKTSNLREVVQKELTRRGERCSCIRCREVRRQQVREEALRLTVSTYTTDLTVEHFLQFVVVEEGERDSHAANLERAPLAGFLRLSLPKTPTAGSRAFLEEIRGNAMIREVHVYGPALAIGRSEAGAAQHVGVGTRLLAEARRLSRAAGFDRISVIAATGTQAYYAARGFEPGDLYMTGPT
jgi:elongator complex protein 3